MTYEKSGTCWYCGVKLTALEYGREDSCAQCGRDTKVCKGCFFYDPAVNNSCRENQAERVVDKERSNFCDYFKPTKSLAASPLSRDQLKAAADALFKKK